MLWIPWRLIWPREFYDGGWERKPDSLLFTTEALRDNKPLPPVFVIERADWWPEPRPPKSSRTKWVLMNGHHRYACAVALGFYKIPCVVSYQVFDLEAQWVQWRRDEKHFDRLQLLELT